MSARATFLFLYVISGTAGLIYEVAWVRLLTLHLGQTTAAVSTVLSAFMGGLALGAAIAARLTPTWSKLQALRAYAALEVATAACATLLPIALQSLTPALGWAYGEAGGTWFGVSRILTALVLVAVPAAAMGGTFPVAVRWFVGRTDRIGTHVGTLYAANTIGAAGGAAAAGFILLPASGLYGATAMGVALNALAAGGALWLAAREPDFQPADPQRKPATRRPARPLDSSTTAAHQAIVRTAVAVSGFVSLAMEVAWTRVLALVVGPTTYAFSAMLTVFIAGIAIGSAIATRLMSRIRDPLAGLGLMLAAVAVGAFGATWFVNDVPLTAANTVIAEATFRSLLVLTATLAAGFLLPLTVALGAAFPLAAAAAMGAADTASREGGYLYAANTVGAIAGSLAAGLFLIPYLGLQQTIVAAGVTAATAGLLLAVAARPRGFGSMTAAAVAVGALFMSARLPDWNRSLLSSGAYKYAPYLRTGDLRAALEAGQLLYYAEGAAGTVSVRKSVGVTSLAIDGKVDASNGPDMLTQKLLAHLPLLLHPAPRDVGIIGLGSGVTLGATLVYPVAHVDVVEISPEVVEASSFFEAENHGALQDPRVRLIRGDGRAHLLYSSRTYDVIISEPSNPWMAGVASLFTREFFAAVRSRLTPGGVFCQWAHTYDISERDLRSIAATFASVFPNGSIWLLGEGDVLLVAVDGSLEQRLLDLRAAWQRPGVAGDLDEVGVRQPFSVLSLMVGGPAALRRYSADALIQTDARGALEFSAPQSIVGPSAGKNSERLRALATEVPLPSVVHTATVGAGAVEWRDRGIMLLRAAAHRPAFNDLSRAAALDPDDAETLASLVRAAALSGQAAEARRQLESFVAADIRNVAARLELSRLLAAQGAFDEAIGVLEEIRRRDPSHAAAREQLASVFGDAGNPDRLAPVVEEMRREAPDSVATLYYDAVLHFLGGRVAAATALGERAVALEPGHARCHNLLGAAYGRQRQLDRARAAFQAAIRADPRFPEPYVNLGLLELQVRNPEAAQGHFAEALTADPASAPAWQGLVLALEQSGERERAERVRRAGH